MKKTLLKISFAILFFSMLAACGDDKAKELAIKENKENIKETKRLEKERIRIEKEKLAMDAEKLAMEATKEKDRLLALEKLERIFQDVYDVMVSAKKTYFYDQPDFATKRKAFLVQYDEASILRTRNGFGFIEFYNYQTEKTTSGWMDLADLEPTEHGD